MNWRILGADLSMSCSAVAWQHERTGVQAKHVETKAKPRTLRSSRVPESASVDRARRLIAVEDWYLKEFAKPGDLVFVEGLVGASPSAAVLGGVGWLIRCGIIRWGGTFVELPPKTIKLFVSGNGNADKADMRAAWLGLTGVELANDDEVDAAGAYCIGRELSGLSHPLRDVPSSHTRALDKLSWSPKDLPARGSKELEL